MESSPDFDSPFVSEAKLYFFPISYFSTKIPYATPIAPMMSRKQLVNAFLTPHTVVCDVWTF